MLASSRRMVHTNLEGNLDHRGIFTSYCLKNFYDVLCVSKKVLRKLNLLKKKKMKKNFTCAVFHFINRGIMKKT